MVDHALSYAVVTPARDEAERLPVLAECLRNQTQPPTAWIVVDNGSSDDTARVARQLASDYGWISVRSAPGETVPTRGGPVARAFVAGVATLSPPPNVVVKIDADITFESDYFERLLAAFAREPELGIAGGTCYELQRGRWVRRHVTGTRVRGASRAYRWACLHDVLPLEDRAGWDGIDELKAIARGWRTRSLHDLPFYHHRVVGQRDASAHERLVEVGRAAYYAGYRPSYLLLRALYKARLEPAALVMLWGYVGAALRREERCPDERARSYLREEQRLRKLPLRAREALGRRTTT